MRKNKICKIGISWVLLMMHAVMNLYSQHARDHLLVFFAPGYVVELLCFLDLGCVLCSGCHCELCKREMFQFCLILGLKDDESDFITYRSSEYHWRGSEATTLVWLTCSYQDSRLVQLLRARILTLSLVRTLFDQRL